jgi:hypothetical protein
MFFNARIPLRAFILHKPIYQEQHHTLKCNIPVTLVLTKANSLLFHLPFHLVVWADMYFFCCSHGTRRSTVRCKEPWFWNAGFAVRNLNFILFNLRFLLYISHGLHLSKCWVCYRSFISLQRRRRDAEDTVSFSCCPIWFCYVRFFRYLPHAAERGIGANPAGLTVCAISSRTGAAMKGSGRWSRIALPNWEPIRHPPDRSPIG